MWAAIGASNFRNAANAVKAADSQNNPRTQTYKRCRQQYNIQLQNQASASGNHTEIQPFCRLATARSTSVSNNYTISNTIPTWVLYLFEGFFFFFFCIFYMPAASVWLGFTPTYCTTLQDGPYTESLLRLLCATNDANDIYGYMTLTCLVSAYRAHD